MAHSNYICFLEAQVCTVIEKDFVKQIRYIERGRELQLNRINVVLYVRYAAKILAAQGGQETNNDKHLICIYTCKKKTVRYLTNKVVHPFKFWPKIFLSQLCSLERNDEMMMISFPENP